MELMTNMCILLISLISCDLEKRRLITPVFFIIVVFMLHDNTITKIKDKWTSSSIKTPRPYKEIQKIPKIEFTRINATGIRQQMTKNSTLNNSSQRPEETTENLRRTCRKQKNIVFLKVHKTGSTTTWGIFGRFVQAHNLNMVLPKVTNGSQFNYLSSANIKLKDTIMPLPENLSYNILCNHAIYNKREFKQIMPNDTVNIGILRNPLKVFISTFYFFGYYKLMKQKYSQSDEKQLLHKYIVNPLSVKRSFVYSDRPMTNAMSYDFGIPESQFWNISFLEEYIQEINKDFKLIIITEYFDESLVLMKRYLCWELHDIIYLPINRGHWRYGKDPFLSEGDISYIRRNNHADVLMYEFFKARLENQIKMENASFYEEVRHFKNIIRILQRFCNQQMGDQSSYRVNNSIWNAEFVITWEYCIELYTPELEVLKRLIRKARHKFSL